MRALAVDWSGDALQAHKRMWLAEADEPGRLVRLEAGRNRPEITRHLVSQTGPVAIGLDFAFSFPAWFIHQLGVQTAPALWAHVAEAGEDWLATCAPPFWGRPGHPRLASSETEWRRAEQALARVGGIGPKSVFQIGGAGSVGTGSLRGMPLLDALHLAGASIWPFSAGSWPLALEIYPRLLTGRVHKSKRAARRDLLEERYPWLATEHRRLAVESEDAFDAAVSALVMVEHLDDLQTLPVEADATLRLEGRIWHPGWREDRP
jgi:Protein of unknown function (DUF429)